MMHGQTQIKFTHFVFKKIVSLIWSSLCDNVGKYFTAGQAIDDDMANALCMMDI
jgi:hypothetical protein